MTGGKNLTSQQRQAYREEAARKAAAAGFVPRYPGETPNGRHALETAAAGALITEADVERAEQAIREALTELKEEHR